MFCRSVLPTDFCWSTFCLTCRMNPGASFLRETVLQLNQKQTVVRVTSPLLLLNQFQCITIVYSHYSVFTGHTGITQVQCMLRGCCWKPTDVIVGTCTVELYVLTHLYCMDDIEGFAQSTCLSNTCRESIGAFLQEETVSHLNQE